MAEQLDGLLYLGTVNRALLNLGNVLIGFLEGFFYIPDAFKNVFFFHCLRNWLQNYTNQLKISYK